MTKPLAIVIGHIGKLPYAGMSLYTLHHIGGLQALGYEVHYVERQNVSNQLYDVTADTMTDDPTFAVGYLGTLLPEYAVTRWTFIDWSNQVHGTTDWEGLKTAVREAAFVLTVADPTWFDELGLCERRAFIDGDPMFTQVAMLDPTSLRSSVIRNYPVLFTYARRMGRTGCAVPDAGRQWLPAGPVVVSDWWRVTPVQMGAPVTALLHWSAGSEVVWDGVSYGHKDREFERFVDLPKRSTHQFVLAVGGSAPRDDLSDVGWDCINPLRVTRTIDAYRSFIDGSFTELGVAKHAYVASRCGWFSDRSACFLASGRPVLHQDTGFDEWLPSGAGVLKFSTTEEVVDALADLSANYAAHVDAARQIVHDHLEARTVLETILRDAGFR